MHLPPWFSQPPWPLWSPWGGHVLRSAGSVWAPLSLGCSLGSPPAASLLTAFFWVSNVKSCFSPKSNLSWSQVIFFLFMEDLLGITEIDISVLPASLDCVSWGGGICCDFSDHFLVMCCIFSCVQQIFPLPHPFIRPLFLTCVQS